MQVIVFDPDTDRILRVVECSASVPTNQALEGEKCLVVDDETLVDDELHYVDSAGDGPRIVTRSSFDTAHTIDGLSVTWSSLPVGTVIRVMGQTMVADGDDETEFDVPGTYRIELFHPHYLDDVLEVTVE